MALHKDLTGADLHEPKGIASAGANRVYVSNGSGSGSWTTVSSIVAAHPPSTIIGVGQTWRDLRSSRAHSSVYTNSTGRPIQVHIVGDPHAANRWFQMRASSSASWINVACMNEGSGATRASSTVSTIVPSGWQYRLNGQVYILSWAELR